MTGLSVPDAGGSFVGWDSTAGIMCDSRLGLDRVAHAFLVAPEALVAQHEAHAALQLGVFLVAVAAVFTEVAGTVGLAEFHPP